MLVSPTESRDQYLLPPPIKLNAHANVRALLRHHKHSPKPLRAVSNHQHHPRMILCLARLRLMYPLGRISSQYPKAQCSIPRGECPLSLCVVFIVCSRTRMHGEPEDSETNQLRYIANTIVEQAKRRRLNSFYRRKVCKVMMVHSPKLNPSRHFIAPLDICQLAPPSHLQSPLISISPLTIDLVFLNQAKSTWSRRKRYIIAADTCANGT